VTDFLCWKTKDRRGRNTGSSHGGETVFFWHFSGR